jgi:hypothetical protein
LTHRFTALSVSAANVIAAAAITVLVVIILVGLWG